VRLAAPRGELANRINDNYNNFDAGPEMIVTAFVLGAVLLSILGIILSFVTRRRTRVPDESSIDTVAQLDAALAIQQAIQIAELQRRMTDRSYLAHALFALAILMQIIALVLDHFAHPSIAAMGILPGFVIVVMARASRRRYAQRQLEAYLRSG